MNNRWRGTAEDYYSGSSDGAFSQQFEPIGDDYIFRARGVGRGVRVSAEEREAFLDRYGATVRRWAQICAIPGCVLMFMALVFMDRGVAEYIGAWWLLAPAPAIGAFVIVHRRAFSAPTRALASRPTWAPAYTRQERLRLWLSVWTYWGIGLYALWPLPWIYSDIYFWGPGEDLSRGEIVKFVFSGLVVGFAILTAFRKWRMERRDRRGEMGA